MDSNDMRSVRDLLRQERRREYELALVARGLQPGVPVTQAPFEPCDCGIHAPENLTYTLSGPCAVAPCECEDCIVHMDGRDFPAKRYFKTINGECCQIIEWKYTPVMDAGVRPEHKDVLTESDLERLKELSRKVANETKEEEKRRRQRRREEVLREPDYEAGFEAMREAGRRLAMKREQAFWDAFLFKDGPPLEPDPDNDVRPDHVR